MDPILYDAERLERALAAWQAGQSPQAVFDELPAQLRPAARAALGLDQAGGDRVAGARPSFVMALEDQLRADLRLGIGRPSAVSEPAPTASPRPARWLLAAVLLGLGLLGGYGMRGESPYERSTPVEVAIRSIDRAPVVVPNADAGRLPWLPDREPLPPVLITAAAPDPALSAAGAAPAAAPASAYRAAPAARGRDTAPASAAPAIAAAELPPAASPAPVAADEEVDAAEPPAPSAVAGAVEPTVAPPQEAPPTRTPDAEPEP
ncbi:MAG TPA: hypothetical protein PK826_05440 [Anaerolineae bacterium]|nr:hypothetical protein [Anaerolineae bacterium]HRA19526.1 hypothetical protein [Anaerolineae bacterium]